MKSLAVIGDFYKSRSEKGNDLTNEAHNEEDREVNESFCSSPTKRKRNEHKLTQREEEISKSFFPPLKRSQRRYEMVNEYHVECTSDRSFDEHRDSSGLNDDCSMTRKDRWPIDSLNRTNENRQRHQQHNWPDQDWLMNKRRETWSSLVDLND